MKRIAFALLLLVTTIAVAEDVDPKVKTSRRRDPSIELPPATLSPALAIVKYQERERMWVPRTPGVVERRPALLTYNVPGQYVGAYLWDERQMEYVEITAPCDLFIGPVTVEAASAWSDPTLADVIHALEKVQQVEDTRRKLIDRARRRVGAISQAGSEMRTEMALAPEATAPNPQPAIVVPAVPAAPVVTTVYREVQVPTPSRLAGLVESRLGWLLLGVLVIGIVAGFATRGSGSRQIVISPEEHARAAAALEQRLRADALRIQRLSSAVDEEEARFIQRVSAITGRS